MSRVKYAPHAISMLLISGLHACASSPESASAAASDPVMQAMEEASRPASPAEIAAAERSDPLTRANFWADEYRKDAVSLPTTLAFMRALRAIGSNERAMEIASTAVPLHPNSFEIYLELGRAQLSLEKYQEAAIAFARSADLAPVTEAAPLAALGVTFDRMENHLKAQEAYEIALQREPDRMSTLSNYGLSLALTGDLAGAEAQLRKAAAHPEADVRVRQNLALVLGLQGRFDEMVAVDPAAPRRTVEANRQALRAMLVPERTYSDIEPANDTTPTITEQMPTVSERNVDSEDMPPPQSSPQGEDLAGGQQASPSLRPRLRGTQSD